MVQKVLIAALRILAEKNLVLWHGGNLDTIQDGVTHKKGRWEGGPGLYLTTHYDTAKKYAKGSRKLYRVIIAEGTAIEDATLDEQVAKGFVNKYVIRSKRPDILERIDNRLKDGKLDAYIFNNIMINEEAIKSSNTNSLRKLYVDNGIDYSIQDNLFGWHERAIVLFNMAKIISKERVDPKEKIEVFDLPTEFK